MPTAFSNKDKWEVIVNIAKKNPFFPRVRTTWGSVMDKSVDKVHNSNQSAQSESVKEWQR